MKGSLFVISAPSGCGKTTVINEMLKRDSGLVRCLTYTTRDLRPGEKNGVDYHFVSPADFEKKKNSEFFLEWASVYDNFYGTAQSDVERLLGEGKDVILSVDVQGARTVRSKMSATLIFLTPPSLEALKERLEKRGTENSAVFQRRLQEAETEMAQTAFYDYTVMNDTLEHSIQNVLNLIQIERSKRSLLHDCSS